MPTSPKVAGIRLFKTSLSNLSTCYSSMFLAPSFLINTLDKLVRDFFWEGSRDDGGMHNVNQETKQHPKLMGGLGIGNFRHCNSAFLAKWIWQFLTEHDVLRQKIIIVNHHLTGRGWSSPNHHGSHQSPWRYIYQAIGLIASRVQRRIGDGTATFLDRFPI